MGRSQQSFRGRRLSSRARRGYQYELVFACAGDSLHELVGYKNYQAMQFLISRDIDMTIRDYRWGVTAEGWARVAAKDEKLGQFLQDAQQRREQASR